MLLIFYFSPVVLFLYIIIFGKAYMYNNSCRYIMEIYWLYFLLMPLQSSSNVTRMSIHLHMYIYIVYHLRNTAFHPFIHQIHRQLIFILNTANVYTHAENSHYSIWAPLRRPTHCESYCIGNCATSASEWNCPWRIWYADDDGKCPGRVRPATLCDPRWSLSVSRWLMWRRRCLMRP